MRYQTAMVLPFVIILFLQGCMTYDKNKNGPGSLLLSQSELERLFRHEKTFATDLQGNSVEITCYPDGTQKLVSRGTADMSEDVGTYTIRNGQKCDRWERTYGAREQCLKFNFVSRGRYYLVTPDGSLHAYITMK
jgi:hypothetical protein